MIPICTRKHILPHGPVSHAPLEREHGVPLPSPAPHRGLPSEVWPPLSWASLGPPGPGVKAGGGLLSSEEMLT